MTKRASCFSNKKAKQGKRLPHVNTHARVQKSGMTDYRPDHGQNTRRALPGYGSPRATLSLYVNLENTLSLHGC